MYSSQLPNKRSKYMPKTYAIYCLICLKGAFDETWTHSCFQYKWPLVAQTGLYRSRCFYFLECVYFGLLYPPLIFNYIYMIYIYYIYIYIYMLYSHLHHHSASQRRNIKDRRMNERRMIKTREDFLTNILPLTLLQGLKGLFKGLHVRGCWRPNVNFIFWPHCYDRHVVSLLFSWCWGLLHRGFPRAPSVWCGLPYHISSLALWESAGNCIGGFRGPSRSGVAFPTTARL